MRYSWLIAVVLAGHALGALAPPAAHAEPRKFTQAELQRAKTHIATKLSAAQRASLDKLAAKSGRTAAEELLVIQAKGRKARKGKGGSLGWFSDDVNVPEE